jgi:hypothetical protein
VRRTTVICFARFGKVLFPPKYRSLMYAVNKSSLNIRIRIRIRIILFYL